MPPPSRAEACFCSTFYVLRSPPSCRRSEISRRLAGCRSFTFQNFRGSKLPRGNGGSKLPHSKKALQALQNSLNKFLGQEPSLTPVFVDSHAHLDDSDFDSDREAVIERARIAGLRYILAIESGTPDGLGSTIPIAEKYDWIYATVGIHPHEARKAEERHFNLLRATAAKPKVLAIGEIGLDYHYDHSPREAQRPVLIEQLGLAEEFKLPVVIHCREAWSDLREIVENDWRSTGLGGILHCFSGTRDDAFRFLDWGFLVSFAGNLTFKKADELRAVAREIPLDRLLSETDSPYLAPIPYRGKRNEPAYVREVTGALASLRNMPEEEMAQQLLANFVCFFRLT